MINEQLLKKQNTSVYIENEPKATDFTVERAEDYIKANEGSVKHDKRHTYHAMPPIGWANDPNGFCYAFGKYNLFFQFHPYSAECGPMHWGHFVTEDLVRWNWVKTAISPDMSYDKGGCFSGSSIEKDGKQYLFYTAVSGDRQNQAMAVSDDGVTFQKKGVIVSGGLLPSGCSVHDFRDPYVFEKDGKHYMLCGSKAADGDAQVVMFQSADLSEWNFAGVIRKDGSPKLGIYECPSFFSFGEKDVLITSPQGYERERYRYNNVNSSIYSVGTLDLGKGVFAIESDDEIDGGLDFYAPQTLQSPDGRIIMIAWMQMWGRTMPSSADGWTGAFILPRELTLKDGKLYQAPVREIKTYRKNGVHVANVKIGERTVLDGVSGDKIELSLKISAGNAENVRIRIYESENEYASVCYSKTENTVIFDRSKTGTEISCDPKENNGYTRSVKLKECGGEISFRIFLDVTSCEVFINDGERVLTSNVYTNERGKGISLSADGDGAVILSLDKYDIEV